MDAAAEGGYVCKFVDAPSEELLCGICQLPAKDPRLSVCCGSNFCAACLRRLPTTDGGCPVCEEKESAFAAFPNKLSDRAIKKLLVLCSNSEKGCGWKEKLSELEGHLASCPFEELLCSAGCGLILQRQKFDSHLETECPSRPAECEFCQLAGEYQFITGQHWEECPSRIVPCPNGCGIADLSCAKLKEHLASTCPLKKTSCSFHTGCTADVIVGHQEQHDEEFVKEHLRLVREELAKASEELNIVKELRIAEEVDSQTSEMSATPSKKAKASDLQDQLVATVTKIQAMEAEVKQCKQLTQSLIHVVSGMEWTTRLKISSNLSSEIEMVPPVIVRVPMKRSETASYVTPLFLSGENGYRMRLNIDVTSRPIDGHQNSAHLTIQLQFLSGPHDAILAWPAKGSVHIEMLNQISDNYHAITVHNINGEQDEFEINSMDKLVCDYWLNDCVYFRLHYTQG